MSSSVSGFGIRPTFNNFNHQSVETLNKIFQEISNLGEQLKRMGSPADLDLVEEILNRFKAISRKSIEPNELNMSTLLDLSLPSGIKDSLIKLDEEIGDILVDTPAYAENIKERLHILIRDVHEFSKPLDFFKSSEKHYQAQSASPSSPFFSEIQRAKSILSNASLPTFFASWFAEIEQIYNFIRAYNLSPEAQESLFFYLAHRYQYNAPFSQKENERLSYETSPLAITERNVIGHGVQAAA